ncbi:MAG: mannan endo-1,4-beta-mannosidase A and B [Clostridia bacterium]|nr:mannan endo-1,4-beta-mannosidase A and B [Clostridia bacterium]
MKHTQKIILNIFVVLIAVCILFACVGCSKNEESAYVTLLSNKNSTAETDALYNYILSTYKTKIITGQQENTGLNPDYEVDYIYEATGKYPAIRGFDFIHDDFDGVVERAKAWHTRGGIVTICWHCSASFDKGYEECQADELTAAQWDAMLTEGTPEHAAAIAGMDKAGNALLELQEAGIPVLWRPFHEFDGWWFWWSKVADQAGADTSNYFKRLWAMMYNHYTNDLHLNNLIWVLGFSYAGTRMPKFYPGSSYCDIVGADSYDVSIRGAEPRLYDKLYKLVGDSKPIVFHETGLIPTAQQFKEVPWGWFMTWHTTWLTEKNTTEALNTLYNDPYVITLEDLLDRTLALD